MKVELLHVTPLLTCSTAIRKCYKSASYSDNGGDKDMNLIDRIGNKMRHESVKNHINYTFEIDDISTKSLLALTRHDIGTEFSVESTRFTLSKRKGELSYSASKNNDVNEYLDTIMSMVSEAIKLGIPNDEVSLMLPQAYNYSLVATFSMTALQHFLKLRLKADAHWMMQELAVNIYMAIPSEHKYLFKECLEESND